MHGVMIFLIRVENMMISLIKDSKAAHNANATYARCNNAGENEILEGIAEIGI